MLKVYGLKQCSTTKKIVKYMQDNGFVLGEIIDIREQAPSVAELRQVYPMTDGKIRKMVNTSGELYRELGLKDKLDAMSIDEVLELLHQNGMLIKRPLLVDQEKGSAGSNLKDLNRIWEINSK